MARLLKVDCREGSATKDRVRLPGVGRFGAAGGVFFGGEWKVASERGSIQPRAVLLKRG